MKFIKTALDDRWDRFVETSPQGSIFSTSAFLQGTGFNVDAYYVKKGNQIIGGFVGIEKDGNIIQAPHVVHSGVLFANHHENKNAAQRHALEYEITEFIIGEIVNIYNDIEFNLHPAIIDVRPFLWWNQGIFKMRFNVSARYTSLITPNYEECSNTRKQIIRKLTDDPKIINEPLKMYGLAEEYTKLYGNDPINIMRGLHEHRMLYVLCCENDKLAIGVYKDIGYMLWQVGKEHATRLLWSAMHNLNCAFYDLEGINSPKRGAFKLSFGGSVTPYYQVKLTPR